MINATKINDALQKIRLCPGYDTKLHLMMRLQLLSSVWSSSSLSLLPG